MTQLSTPRDFLRVIASRRLTVIGVTVIAVVIGAAYSVLHKKVYSASATIQFVQQQDIGVFVPGVQTPVDVSPSTSAVANSQIVSRPDVVATVHATAGSGLSVGALQNDLNVTVQPNSNLIQITVNASNGALAARLANAFARATRAAVRSEVRSTYARDSRALTRALARNNLDATTQAAYNQAISRVDILSQVADPVQIVKTATVPGAPTSPKPVTDTLLALVVGLFVGVGTAFLRNAFDRRFSDAAAVQRTLELPLVGYVPADALGMAARNGATSTSRELETFRVLRTNASFLAPKPGVRSVVVTSPVAEEGKSTVSSWYGYVSSAAGARTLIVDCDLRKPRLAERFDVPSGPGLTDFLAGDATPQEVLRVIEVDGPDAVPLTLVPAGTQLLQPAETLGSRKFHAFVDEVTRVYDLVIFDTAPLLPVSDTLQLVPHADAVLLCIRVAQTTVEQARLAKQALAQLPSRPTGLVVAGIKRDDDYYYGYPSYGDERAPGQRTETPERLTGAEPTSRGRFGRRR